jgi:hypothetical protein
MLQSTTERILKKIGTRYCMHLLIRSLFILPYCPLVLSVIFYIYPSISTVLLILYTMPASTATTERSFSALRRLKTYLRTTMLQDGLTSLAVLHVHRDIDTGIDMRSFTLGKSRHKQNGAD